MGGSSNYADWGQTSINERIKYIVDTFFKGNTTQMALGHGKKSVTDRYINFNMKKVDDANRRVIDYLFEKEKPGS